MNKNYFPAVTHFGNFIFGNISEDYEKSPIRGNKSQ